MKNGLYRTTAMLAAELSASTEIKGTVCTWQIIRTFTKGDVPEPPRLGKARVISPAMVPAIIAALRKRGYLPPADGVEA